MKQQPSSAHQLLPRFSETQRTKTRVDSDGTLIIPGKLGHIYQYDDLSLAVIVIPSPPRKNYWAFTRKKLASIGFTVVQDGDYEGAATFDAANQEQAQAAIQAAGIKRKRQLSPSQVNRQISWLKASAGRAL